MKHTQKKRLLEELHKIKFKTRNFRELFSIFCSIRSSILFPKIEELLHV